MGELWATTTLTDSITGTIFGRVDCVEFESYEKLESQFEAQVRQYLEAGTCEASTARSGRR